MKLLITSLQIKLTDLMMLFIKPKAFFEQYQTANKRQNIIVAAICYGIYHTLNRFDELLLRDSLDRPRSGWEHLSPLVDGPWSSYWLFLIIVGVLAAPVAYYLGGWWYWVRLKIASKFDPQSDDNLQPDKKTARLIYIYSQFVMGFPPLVMLLLQTLFYDNYRQAWNDDLGWFAILALLPYWSCLVSYHGAMHFNPQLERSKAIVLLVICPAFTYLSIQYAFWHFALKQMS